MTLHIRKQLSFSRRQRPQRHALIQLYIVSDLRRFSNYDAGTMIDKKIFSDHRARINIDTGSTVRIFRHNARNKRHLPDIQLMCHPVHKDRKHARIGRNDLLSALCSRISVKSCLHIL